MTLIGDIENFSKESSYPLDINEHSLLLIHQGEQFYLIENKCGHFGVPLSDAEINSNEIICAQHGISFSLETGNVINRPYENCDSIKVYSLTIEDDQLYCNEL